MSLSKDLNMISAKLDKAVALLDDIDTKVSCLDDDYDLYDFSIDRLQVWRSDFIDAMGRVDSFAYDFDHFAFDGDSIREVDDEEENYEDHKDKDSA